eukprot:6571061-Lingulodinium_polyedra.AAC.1
MAWVAAVYPENVHGTPPAGVVVGPSGWGGRPTEPTELTWEPYVARVINWTWVRYNEKALRKDASRVGGYLADYISTELADRAGHT